MDFKPGEQIKHKYGDYYVYGNFVRKENQKGTNTVWMKIHHFQLDEKGRKTGGGEGLLWDVRGDYEINKIQKGW